MITQQDIHALLAGFGIRHDDTVTIHASLRAAGPIAGGADGLIDGLASWLSEGLLLVPTHTWEGVTKENPFYDVRASLPCIGTLARVAAFRKDGVRSLHPTHSVTVFGKNARAYVEGEETCATPGPVGSALSRLYERSGKILLLGVGHDSNTYLHTVDERLKLPNRLNPEGFPITITDWDGHTIQLPDFHPHFTQGLDAGISEYYPNYAPALEATEAVTHGQLGSAEVTCCDARRMTDVIARLWEQAEEDICLGEREIPEAWYRDI